jgi:hypothetical protein
MSQYTQSPIQVQKEWRVKTAGTGTAVGDILVQAMRTSGGSSVQAKWFNLTQGTILTTNPAVSALVQNNSNGQLLPANQNGRQSFSWVTGGWSPSSVGMQTLSTGTVSVDGGANVVTTTTYQVPAGKRLRILSMDFTNTSNTNIGANTRVWASIGLKQDSITPTGTSPDVYKFRWMSANNTGTAQAAPSINQNMLLKFPDGAIDIGPSQFICIWVFEADTVGLAPFMSMNGYLYDAQ